MTKNPFINALSGLLYIALVASIMFFSSTFDSKEPTILIPITVLSLFVFSAALMAYIFLYQPLQLFLEGEKKRAVNLFLSTLGIFGISAGALSLIGAYISTHPF